MAEVAKLSTTNSFGDRSEFKVRREGYGREEDLPASYRLAPQWPSGITQVVRATDTQRRWVMILRAAETESDVAKGRSSDLEQLIYHTGKLYFQPPGETTTYEVVVASHIKMPLSRDFNGNGVWNVQVELVGSEVAP